MDWIKKNYDQALLLLVSLVLLGVSGWLLLNAMNFGETFESLRGEVTHNNKIPDLDMAVIDQSTAGLAKPASWTSQHGSFFVSEKYLAKDGALISPLQPGGQALHPPVPNEWLSKNNLDLLSESVLDDDPDGDGFTNLDEWKGVKGDGSDSTNPQDKNSHPPFWTKLRLVRAIQQPFRLLFNAYDGDPNKPESLTFQINTVDIKQPSQFLKLNEPIAKTKFKVVKFVLKKVMNSSTGVEQDASELTVENTETGDQVVLVMEKLVNSPDSYALFKNLLDNSQFPVKKDKTFTLKQEPAVTYKLVDIKDTEALIENTKTGEKIKVPKLETP